jgi:hypothetical protein
MLNLTLSNDFHQTEVTIRPTSQPNGTWLISHSQKQRAWRTLCGIKGCSCGGEFGERPSQVNLIRETSDGYQIAPI